MTKKRAPRSTGKSDPHGKAVPESGRNSLSIGKLFKATHRRIRDIERNALAKIGGGKEKS